MGKTAKKEKSVPVEKKEPQFISAAGAEKGVKYLNWSLKTVLEALGTSRSLGPLQEYAFRGYADNGDVLEQHWLLEFYPLRIEPIEVERLMITHEGMKARFASRTTRTSGKVVAVVDEKTGEVVEKRVKKESKPRAAMDPRTGCSPGTSAHSVGEVMLNEKPGPDHRKRCVEILIEKLHMEKPLAQSWYSTHIRRKPEIYGKLGA